jgi:(E)-4-hydroxy-3-methylbut-2-enyl-diphosphate synthase
MAADFIYVGDQDVRYELPGTLRKIVNAKSWQPGAKGSYPLFKASEYVDAGERHPVLNFIRATIHDLTDPFIVQLKSDSTAVLVLESDNEAAMPEMRRAFFKLIDAKCQVPVILKRDYPKTDLEHFLLHAATDTGALLIDGMGDGVWLTAKEVFPKQINDASFGILQASRTRISKTEYISCPSCGRTLFDLEETTAKIRNATHHLKGVKIGIMGCIVNGPGEMADADYGYVGSGPGKITLYKGKEVVKRSIPTEDALDELIDLIKEHGDWVEMESSKV